MPDFEKPAEAVAANEIGETNKQTIENKTALDYFAIALATWGVGYIPLAPGTWGSAVGVLIYIFTARAVCHFGAHLSQLGFSDAQSAAWIHFFISFKLLLFCFAGIWAASRAAKIFNRKDPGKVVVDEVLGQLVCFLFVPFEVSWTVIIAGFFLFRLFDIWKPYPVNLLENLPEGLGICADDILAGVYAGVCLALFYAVSFYF